MSIQKNQNYIKLLELLNTKPFSKSTTSDDLVSAKLTAEKLAEDPNVKLPIIIQGEKGNNILIDREAPDPTKNKKGKVDVRFNLQLTDNHGSSKKYSCDTIKQDGQKISLQHEDIADFSNFEDPKKIFELLEAASDKSDSQPKQSTKEPVQQISPTQDANPVK